MSTAISGTYDVPIAGPSPHLAMLRALLLKLRGIARHLWASTGTALSVTGRLPHAVATAVHSLLSTQAGYRAVTGVVRTVTSGLWGAVRWAARTVGRACRTVANVVTTVVGMASQGAADLLQATVDTVAGKATSLGRRIDGVARGGGELVWALTHTHLVQVTVTLTASAASGLFTVHSLTQGLLATKIVQTMPTLMTAAAWATDPVRLLAVVAAAAGAAILIALGRLIAGSGASGDAGGPDDGGPTCSAETRPMPLPERLTTVDDWVPGIAWDAVAASVRIEIAPDGSVTVVGIPNTVPREYGQIIAQVATTAALQHGRRTVKSRPTPSGDDRRLFTKAAKEAVRDLARRSQPHAA